MKTTSNSNNKRIHLLFISLLVLTFSTFNVFANSGQTVVRNSGSQGHCIKVKSLDQAKYVGVKLENVCDADFDNNGVVDYADFKLFSSYFVEKNLNADLNASGNLSDDDIVIFMAQFNKQQKSMKKGKSVQPLTHKKSSTEIAKQTNITGVSENGLIAHWPLNEGNGTIITDKTSFRHDAKAVNNPAWNNGFLTFDGVNDYVNVGALDIEGKALTLSAWVKADKLANCRSRDCRIISKATGVDKQQHYWMLSTVRVGEKTRLRFRLKANGLTTELIASSGDLKDDEIFYAAAIYDGTSMRLYKNGIEVGNVAKTGNIDTSDSVEAWIGSNPSVANSRPWKGSIADVRIYQKALSVTEISRAIDSIRSEVKLLAHWSLDEGQGITIKDKSGNGHDGVLTNNPTWKNSILSFDGIDDYVNVGVLDIKGKELTLSAWVQADKLENCKAHDCRIISKSKGLYNQDHFWMLSTIRKGNKTRLRFRLKANGSTTTLVASSGDLNNGEIFHVSAVYDGATMRLYKNGLEVGRVAKTGGINASNTVETWIGSNPNAENSRAWKGSLADISIFQKALTQKQILVLKDSFESRNNQPDIPPQIAPLPNETEIVAPTVSVITTPNNVKTIQPKEAAHFLTQSTFGPTSRAIQHLVELNSYESWIEEQFNLSPSYHRPLIKTALFNSKGDPSGQFGRMNAWWDVTVFNDDQLRQRVAFALSEILVISDLHDRLEKPRDTVAEYYDILVRHSFGNFRDLLEDVTLSPAMAIYLSMLGNDKPDPSVNRRADENYAREVLQLFSIGLVELNINGIPKSGANGKPIDTYTQPDVENLARIFTGWAWDTNKYIRNIAAGRERPELVIKPLISFPEFHDQDEKSFLGVTFPAGQAAREDLELALDTIFHHPNVGPFIGKQLIMRLVTSNPSPAYVARVTQAFNNNGEGVRGDLQAVVKAVLLDPEARTSKSIQFGKLKEPLIRLTHLWRAFNASPRLKSAPKDAKYEAFHFYKPEKYLSQAPMRAPSVFNFFRPGFSPFGKIKSQGLVAPEFQITSESRLQKADDAFIKFATKGGFKKSDPINLDLANELALINDPDKLIAHLDLLLTSGNMSKGLSQILEKYFKSNRLEIDDEQLIRNMIALIISSAEYSIQR